MRGRKLFVAPAGLAVMLAAGVVVLWAQPERITRLNFVEIKEGMRRDQVYAIIGPPGDYRNGPTPVDFNHPATTLTVYGEPTDWWYTDTTIYSVRLDPSSGMVVAAGWDSNERIPQTRMENLLWRLKRKWHRWFPEK
jgi:hypothetical protein